MRCVLTCAALCPDAQIIVLPDELQNHPVLPPTAQVIVTGSKTISAKRNIGAWHVPQAYALAFIDSDAYPIGNWLQNALARLIENPDLAAVGGPNMPPPDSSRSELYVGRALTSPLVSGLGYFRKMQKPARLVEGLPSCNLVVRADVYKSLGGMDESLYTGEDVEFCARLRNAGGHILYEPEVAVYHKNRSLKGFIQQRIVYGASVPSLVKKSLNLQVLVMAVPFCFIFFLMLAPLWLLLPYGAHAFGLIIMSYSLAVIIEGIRNSQNYREWFGTIIAILIGNLSPGIGTFMGILKLVNSQTLYRRSRM